MFDPLSVSPLPPYPLPPFYDLSPMITSLLPAQMHMNLYHSFSPSINTLLSLRSSVSRNVPVCVHLCAC